MAANATPQTMSTAPRKRPRTSSAFEYGRVSSTSMTRSRRSRARRSKARKTTPRPRVSSKTWPAARSSNCVGEPRNTTRPASSRARSLQPVPRSATMWVERMIVRSRPRVAISWRNRMRSSGSRPTVGSSTTSRRGRWIRAWAMPRRRVMPPESFFTLRWATSPRPTLSRTVSTRSRRAARSSRPERSARVSRTSSTRWRRQAPNS